MTRRKKPAEKLTLTPKESTRITGFGVTATYRLLNSGEMPHIRNGNRFVIPRVALERWLERKAG